jgi:hypothetical protein
VVKKRTIQHLIKLVPTPAKPVHAGSAKAWQKIKKRAKLPDWLFELYSSYGSGTFAMYDETDRLLDALRLMNAFAQPLLDEHENCGTGWTSERQRHGRLPYPFFPESSDGLFPVASTDQNLFMLIDPKDDQTLYLIDNHGWYFQEVQVAPIDYLYLTFKGERKQILNQDLLAIPEDATICDVRFLRNDENSFKQAR